MKLLIVEDEPQQALGLKTTIRSWFPELEIEVAVEVDAIAGSCAAAKFDVAILDIMIDGVPVFDFLPEELPVQQLVFVTGTDRFMQHAFQCYAVDYILKPYDPKRLRTSLELSMERVQSRQRFIGGHWTTLRKDMRSGKVQYLALPFSEGTEFVRLEDIIAIEAQRSYCRVYLLDGAQKLVSRSLAWAEELLHPEGFFRTHRSWLVNPRHVRAFLKHQGYSLRMVNGLLVQVAEQAKERVAEWLRGLSTGA
jgi:two-component system LytT family response regulator